MSQAPSIHPSMSRHLYEETQALHQQIEGQQFFRALQEKKLTEGLYCQLLVDLHAVYSALEREWLKHLSTEPLKELYFPALCRTASLEQDIASFQETSIKPSAAALGYQGHLEKLAEKDARYLTSHGYVRYLGDLSGGQMIGKWVTACYGPGHSAFYDFDSLLGEGATGSSAVRFKNLWKSRFDAYSWTSSEAVNLVEEAKQSFIYSGQVLKSSLNIN